MLLSRDSCPILFYSLKSNTYIQALSKAWRCEQVLRSPLALDLFAAVRAGSTRRRYLRTGRCGHGIGSTFGFSIIVASSSSLGCCPCLLVLTVNPDHFSAFEWIVAEKSLISWFILWLIRDRDGCSCPAMWNADRGWCSMVLLLGRLSG